MELWNTREGRLCRMGLILRNESFLNDSVTWKPTLQVRHMRLLVHSGGCKENKQKLLAVYSCIFLYEISFGCS